MKFVVSGATGFIGLHLIKFLSRKGHTVIALYKNKKKIKKIKGVKWTNFDLMRYGSKDIEFKDKILIHLAWLGLSKYNNEIHYNQILHHKKFLSFAINQGVKKIFVLGSCFEYGLKKGCLVESMKIKPKNKYARSKYEIFKFLKKKKKEHDFDLKWGRLFYVYGSGQSKDFLYGLFKNSLIKNKIFKVNYPNDCIDMLNIAKLVKYIYKICISKSKIDLVNICSGKKIKIKNLINLWLEKEKKKKNFKIIFKTNNLIKIDFYGSNVRLNNLIKNDRS